MPANVTINSKYGKYEVSYKVDDNMISFKRYFSPVSIQFAAEEYTDFSAFYNNIYLTDRKKIIFVKKAS